MSETLKKVKQAAKVAGKEGVEENEAIIALAKSKDKEEALANVIESPGGEIMFDVLRASCTATLNDLVDNFTVYKIEDLIPRLALLKARLDLIARIKLAKGVAEGYEAQLEQEIKNLVA